MNSSISKCINKVISVCLLVVFVTTTVLPPNYAQALETSQLPEPGRLVGLSDGFSPALIRGISIHPDNPFRFDFIIDGGDNALKGEALHEASSRMIKYFLAALTVKQEDLWVNLSPLEEDRISTESLGVTELGRDMLAQDYLLKQVMSSLSYPEEGLGQKFWKRVYDKIGISGDLNFDAFNKVWIVPDRAEVYEEGGSAYVLQGRLKVMLDRDYLAEQVTGHRTQVTGDAIAGKNNFVIAGKENSDISSKENTEIAGKENTVIARQFPDEGRSTTWQSQSDIITPLSRHDGVLIQPPTGHRPLATDHYLETVREILIPEIEREVNEGEQFATIRQIYQAVILANWYKKRLKESILVQAYVDQDKTLGIDVEDKEIKQKIYERYIEAFRAGVYNYIREDYDAAEEMEIPRKYFSGGVVFESERPDRYWGPATTPPAGFALFFARQMSKAAGADNLSRVEVEAVKHDQIIAKMEAKSSASGRNPHRAKYMGHAFPVSNLSNILVNLKLKSLESLAVEGINAKSGMSGESITDVGKDFILSKFYDKPQITIDLLVEVEDGAFAVEYADANGLRTFSGLHLHIDEIFEWAEIGMIDGEEGVNDEEDGEFTVSESEAQSALRIKAILNRFVEYARKKGLVEELVEPEGDIYFRWGYIDDTYSSDDATVGILLPVEGSVFEEELSERDFDDVSGSDEFLAPIEVNLGNAVFIAHTKTDEEGFKQELSRELEQLGLSKKEITNRLNRVLIFSNNGGLFPGVSSIEGAMIFLTEQARGKRIMDRKNRRVVQLETQRQEIDSSVSGNKSSLAGREQPTIRVESAEALTDELTPLLRGLGLDAKIYEVSQIMTNTELDEIEGEGIRVLMNSFFGPIGFGIAADIIDGKNVITAISPGRWVNDMAVMPEERETIVSLLVMWLHWAGQRGFQEAQLEVVSRNTLLAALERLHVGREIEDLYEFVPLSEAIKHHHDDRFITEKIIIRLGKINIDPISTRSAGDTQKSSLTGRHDVNDDEYRKEKTEIMIKILRGVVKSAEDPNNDDALFMNIGWSLLSSLQHVARQSQMTVAEVIRTWSTPVTMPDGRVHYQLGPVPGEDGFVTIGVEGEDLVLTAQQPENNYTGERVYSFQTDSDEADSYQGLLQEFRNAVAPVWDGEAPRGISPYEEIAAMDAAEIVESYLEGRISLHIIEEDNETGRKFTPQTVTDQLVQDLIEEIKEGVDPFQRDRSLRAVQMMNLLYRNDIPGVQQEHIFLAYYEAILPWGYNVVQFRDRTHQLPMYYLASLVAEVADNIPELLDSPAVQSHFRELLANMEWIWTLDDGDVDEISWLDASPVDLLAVRDDQTIYKRIQRDIGPAKSSLAGRDVVLDQQGGVAFDSLNVLVKRNSEGEPLPLPMQDIDLRDIAGLKPVIISITAFEFEELPAQLALYKEEEEAFDGPAELSKARVN